jgi:hypothetical protein
LFAARCARAPRIDFECDPKSIVPASWPTIKCLWRSCTTKCSSTLRLSDPS